MIYKALIFDIDGTAIPTILDAKPSAHVIKSITAAQKMVKVSAATGRSFPHAKSILKAFHLTDPCIISGGTQIIDPVTEETLWEKRLSESQVKEVVALFLPYPYAMGFSDEITGSPAKTKTVIGSERIIYVWGVTKEDAEMFQKTINQIPDTTAHIGGSWTPNMVDIHITHKLATKKNALMKLLPLLGVSKRETLGVGDTDNDLPLFASVGFKIAMGNGTENLKKAADYIAPSVEEDGLATVIEKFIIDPVRTS